MARNWLPVFSWNGEALMAHYYDDYIRNGCRLLLRYWLRAGGGIELDGVPALVG